VSRPEAASTGQSWRYPCRIDVKFQQAVDGLYAAFAAYPLRSVVGGCPCCTSPADNIDLHAAPLRELSTDRLRHYGFTAMFTWGDVEDFKHFLPRLLELTATEGFLGPDTESLYGRLAYAKFDTWPEAEQTAVRAFAMAHWRAPLSKFEFTPRVLEHFHHRGP
jgi:hypothetical protein